MEKKEGAEDQWAGPRRVVVIRHGERQDAVDPDWASHAENPADPPLTERGLRDAREIGGPAVCAGLRREEEEEEDSPREVVLLCSPFRRCVQTALELLPALRQERTVRACVVDCGLAEWLRPSWYPRGDPLPTLCAAQELDPHLWSRSSVEESSVQPEFPERLLVDYYGRVRRAMQALVLEGKEFQGCDLVIVSHGAACDSVPHALVEDLVPAQFYWAPYLATCVVEQQHPDGPFQLVHPQMPYVRELMPHERKQ